VRLQRFRIYGIKGIYLKQREEFEITASQKIATKPHYQDNYLFIVQSPGSPHKEVVFLATSAPASTDGQRI